MPNYRNFQISGSIFTGYNCKVDLDKIENLSEITDYVLKELINMLKSYNLTQLIEEIKKENFHIHSFDFGDILLSNSDNLFYLCSHCKD